MENKTVLQQLIEKMQNKIRPDISILEGENRGLLIAIGFAQSLLPAEKAMLEDAYKNGVSDIIEHEGTFETYYSQFLTTSTK